MRGFLESVGTLAFIRDANPKFVGPTIECYGEEGIETATIRSGPPSEL